MHRSTMLVILPAFVLAAVVVSAAWAQDTGATPVPEDKQAKLMEKFGDQGIDADEDGTLTQDEVHAFFAENHGKGHGKADCDGTQARKGHGHGHDKDCMHGKQGKGRRGMRGHGGKGMGMRGGAPLMGVGRALHRLNALAAEAPPAEFDLEKHAEADADENGELSAAEWTAFATEKRTEVLSRLAKRFPDADADEDGTINDAELESLTDKFLGHVLERHPEADTSEDGALSMEELEAFHATRQAERRVMILEHHPEADLDGDGTLSDEEMEQFQPPRRGSGGMKGGRGHGGRRGASNVL